MGFLNERIILIMLNQLFSLTDVSTAEGKLFAMAAAFLCGIIVTAVYHSVADRPSKYMTVSALIIPAIVQAVIITVNGSIGAGVAAAGAFSLVRFRSIPGNSRDICVLFLAMAAGLVSGLGLVGYAVLLTVILSLMVVITNRIVPPRSRNDIKLLKILIPEDVDYSGLFTDILDEYTATCLLDTVKTVRMGTMYQLEYIITLKKNASVKDMMDKIRTRNGNLTVSFGILPDLRDEL